MSCNCKNKDNCTTDMGRGCSFCNSDQDNSAEACDGCYKLHSYDWLEGYPEMLPTDIFEVRFKNTRKGYYKNVNELPLKKGDIVAVEASPGHDIGIVSMTGDMVARQMKRVGFNPLNGEFKKIYRKTKPYDIEKWQEAIALEHQTMIRSRQIAADLNLNMKIGDVEYQGDKIKAIFYYIADERVDFRELIKIFAEQFKIRIEMKQIGARQEAGRIGGLGSCGRELCCASWISSFVSVTTNAARNQEISLNPQKLAGQCGKLKCCLVYELDTYLDARKEIPRINQPLQALDGEYYLVKTDILSRTMWFSTDPHSMVSMKMLSVDRVKEILKVNQTGRKVDTLEIITENSAKVEDPGFVNAIGEGSLTRFDKKEGEPRRNNKNGRGKGNRDNRPKGSDNQQSKPQGERNTGEKPQSDRPQGDRPQRNRPQGNRNPNGRPQGERGNQGNKAPGGGGDTAKPQNNNAQPQVERPQNGEKPQTERPQGENRSRNNRNRNRNRKGNGNNGGNGTNGGNSEGGKGSGEQ